jgi:cellular nucleic acid-binding protein
MQNNNSEKVCFNCNNPGHEKKDCPHPKASDQMNRNRRKEENFKTIICYNCKGRDHGSNRCPTPIMNNLFESTRLQLEKKKCYTCGGIGHMSPDHKESSNGRYDNFNQGRRINNLNHGRTNYNNNRNYRQ